MTNLVSRRRELVILRSVGLAKEQLFRTLWIECFYYVMGTIVITLTIGSLSGYAICLILIKSEYLVNQVITIHF